jgi:hypothetical protein
VLADPPHGGVEQHLAAEATRHGLRQPVVASLDPEERARARGPSRRKLIDKRNQRQSFGIRQKEPAQPADTGAECRISLDPIEPLGHGLARELTGDRRVPPLSGPAVVRDFSLQPTRRQAKRSFSGPDTTVTASIGGVVGEAAAQNASGLQLQRTGEFEDVSLFLFDEIGPGLAVQTAAEHAAERVDAAANPISRFRDGYRRASAFEIPRRAEAGEPRTSDKNATPRQRSRHLMKHKI